MSDWSNEQVELGKQFSEAEGRGATSLWTAAEILAKARATFPPRASDEKSSWVTYCKEVLKIPERRAAERIRAWEFSQKRGWAPENRPPVWLANLLAGLKATPERESIEGILLKGEYTDASIIDAIRDARRMEEEAAVAQEAAKNANGSRFQPKAQQGKRKHAKKPHPQMVSGKQLSEAVSQLFSDSVRLVQVDAWLEKTDLLTQLQDRINAINEEKLAKGCVIVIEPLVKEV